MMDYNNYDDMDTDTESIEEDMKPQPMAGFRVGVLSSPNKKSQDYEEYPDVRRSVSAPSALAPMSSHGSYHHHPHLQSQGGRCVYFPADVDIESLMDWKQWNEEGKWEQNNNQRMEQERAALININSQEIAVFKYGEKLIGETIEVDSFKCSYFDFSATSSRCPHAGGPLHQGNIEVLPDKSLCVRCPWHKWAFKVGSGHDSWSNYGGDDNSEACFGECVFPHGRDDKTLKVYPTVLDKARKQIKIGFDSIDTSTLMHETF